MFINLRPLFVAELSFIIKNSKVGSFNFLSRSKIVNNSRQIIRPLRNNKSEIGSREAT